MEFLLLQHLLVTRSETKFGGSGAGLAAAA